MQVESLHPGVTKEDISAATGFEMLFAAEVVITPEPTEQQLEILRTQVDPLGMILGKPERREKG